MLVSKLVSWRHLLILSAAGRPVFLLFCTIAIKAACQHQQMAVELKEWVKYFHYGSKQVTKFSDIFITSRLWKKTYHIRMRICEKMLISWGFHNNTIKIWRIWELIRQKELHFLLWKAKWTLCRLSRSSVAKKNRLLNSIMTLFDSRFSILWQLCNLYLPERLRVQTRYREVNADTNRQRLSAGGLNSICNGGAGSWVIKHFQWNRKPALNLWCDSDVVFCSNGDPIFNC